jgi:hypothetical protein
MLANRDNARRRSVRLPPPYHAAHLQIQIIKIHTFTLLTIISQTLTPHVEPYKLVHIERQAFYLTSAVHTIFHAVSRVKPGRLYSWSMCRPTHKHTHTHIYMLMYVYHFWRLARTRKNSIGWMRYAARRLCCSFLVD